MKKYELVAEDTIEFFGIKLFRIRAVRDFGAVKAGDLGGYVESEENLSHDGEAWVSDKARVFDKAQVLDKARVSDWAQVSGTAWVAGRTLVSGEAQVSGWEWQEVAPGVKVRRADAGAAARSRHGAERRSGGSARRSGLPGPPGGRAGAVRMSTQTDHYAEAERRKRLRERSE